MRPPVLPSGNSLGSSPRPPGHGGFNEAAGFTQRKQRDKDQQQGRHGEASMRPPVLPSGNVELVEQLRTKLNASMRPPVLPSGNLWGCLTRIASRPWLQ